MPRDQDDLSPQPAIGKVTAQRPQMVNGGQPAATANPRQGAGYGLSRQLPRSAGTTLTKEPGRVVRSERPRGCGSGFGTPRPPGPRKPASFPDVEGRNSYGHLAQGKQAAHTRQSIYGESRVSLPYVKGGGRSAVTIVSLLARGRPPQAAARRAGLEFVEKLLTTTSPARTRRSGTPACFARVPHRRIAGRAGSWSES
jgi:hypothetical protein